MVRQARSRRHHAPDWGYITQWKKLGGMFALLGLSVCLSVCVRSMGPLFPRTLHGPESTQRRISRSLSPDASARGCVASGIHLRLPELGVTYSCGA